MPGGRHFRPAVAARATGSNAGLTCPRLSVTDLYNDADAYSTIYLPGAAASTATIETKVVSTSMR